LTIENENGELRQLAAIKRAYRKALTSLEEELKTKFERELADRKKKAKEEYLESVVDVIFAEPAAAEASTVTGVPQVEVKTEVTSKPAPPLPVIDCPGCGARVAASAAFCSQCGFFLKEDEKSVAAASSRKLRTRVRR
jgi:hypothetical protein